MHVDGAPAVSATAARNFGHTFLDKSALLPNAELAGTVQLWEWIGDEPVTTFSY
jgi:hypothetical protein